VAIGDQATAPAVEAVALGHLANASFANNIAIGARSEATTQGLAIAIGTDSTANFTSAIALGSTADAAGQLHIALGQGAVTGAIAGGLAPIAIVAGTGADECRQAGAPGAATDKLVIMINGLRYHIALTAAP
jgi:hypothetical protein